MPPLHKKTNVACPGASVVATEYLPAIESQVSAASIPLKAPGISLTQNPYCGVIVPPAADAAAAREHPGARARPQCRRHVATARAVRQHSIGAAELRRPAGWVTGSFCDRAPWTRSTLWASIRP